MPAFKTSSYKTSKAWGMYPKSKPNKSFLCSTFHWLLLTYRVNVKLLVWSARAFSFGLLHFWSIFHCPATKIPSGHSRSVCRCCFSLRSWFFSQLKKTSSLPLGCPVSRDSFFITQLMHHRFAEVFQTHSFFSHTEQVFFLLPLYSQLFHDLPFVSVGWGFMRQRRDGTCLVCHCISGVWHRACKALSTLWWNE